MSLKEAARNMSETHGFDATLRQWERRIAPEKWGFSKYASRDDRLKAIDASGKSLLDVSQRGRRKSTASDGRPSLLEDRNLRRFARREVSRESRHPRARSVSVFSDQSDQEMDDASSAAASPAPSDHLMDLREIQSFTQQDYVPFQDPWIATSTQDSTASVPQIHVFDESQSLSVPQINICAPDEVYIAPDHLSMSLQAQVNVHYPEEHNHEAFGSYHNHIPAQYNDAHIQSQTYSSGDLDRQLESNVDWAESLSSSQKQTQDFTSFAFDNDHAVSFTEMLQLNNQDLQNAMTSNTQHDQFANEPSRTEEARERDLAEHEQNPNFDESTYVDLFSVLKERDSKIMQMISMLKQSLENSTDTEYTRNRIINSITVLERGVQAQSKSVVWRRQTG